MWEAALTMTTTDWKNQLYFGDNLDILRNHVKRCDSIQRPLPNKSGQQSAFEDTWHWNLGSETKGLASPGNPASVHIYLTSAKAPLFMAKTTMPIALAGAETPFLVFPQ